MKVGKVYAKLKSQGVTGLVDAVLRKATRHRLASYQNCRPLFRSKIGLEIGGPSARFKRSGLLPVYTDADRLDNCNFSNNTTWEGSITEGATFRFDKRRAAGTQYIAEATNLSIISSAFYDFVLSSHTLEHTANPLKALSEWTRVLKEEGILALVVPHRDGTFDHRRPVTSLSHLIEDFEHEVSEGDMTHLEEILELHDLAMDPNAGNFESFKHRSTSNLKNRCLHHHVFDTRLAVELIHHINLQILAVDVVTPYDIVVVAQKPTLGQGVQNERFRGIGNEPCWHSRFPTDRAPQRRRA